MRRTRMIIAGGAAAAGLTLGAAALASAETAQGTEDPSTETDDVQEPELDGSVSAPELPDDSSEADEARALESLATVTADEAIVTATEAVPGTADEVELGNENGSVVYEVEVTAKDGTETEVKVDAGNGTVLDIETENEDEADDDGAENETGEVEDD